MVVVAPVLDDLLRAPEHLLRSSSAGLDGAAWVTENSCWTCQPRRHSGVAHDRDRETAFAVDEADDPLLEPWPFLLIARTGRVTGMAAPYCEGGTASTAGYWGFPAYSRLHFDGVAAPRGRTWCTFQVVYLSTVIVTAAVYWRCSELRPASRANPSP